MHLSNCIPGQEVVEAMFHAHKNSAAVVFYIIFLMALKFCIIFNNLSAYKTPGLYTE